MEFDVRDYWQQIAALVAFAVAWARLKSTQDAHAQAIADLRREGDRTREQAHGQAVMLATISESLASIKITLDRLYERTEKRD